MMINEREIQVNFYRYNPADSTSTKELLQYDRYARQAIEDAEKLIQQAREYRLRLAERVKELELMPFVIRVTLQRVKNSWTGKIKYFVWTDKVFDDGTYQRLDVSDYEGKERHKAITEFRRIKKEFPGYEFVEDIAKARWER